MTDRDDKGRVGPGNELGKETRFSEGQKAALTHGAYSFLRTGELPESAKEIQPLLDNLRAGLIADLGGESVLTTAQELLISQTVTLWGFCLLIEKYVLKNGPFVPVKDRRQQTVDIKMIGPLNAFYLSSMANIRRTIETLGAQKPRTFETATPLERYMNEKEKD